MDDDKKETTFVKDQKIVVKEVSIESRVLNNVNLINKIRFNTTIGDITWKPKTEVVKQINNFITKTMVPITLSDIPEKVQQINQICQDLGACPMIAEFSVMDTVDKNKMPVQYRFINSEKILDKWIIITVKTDEEVVDDGSKNPNHPTSPPPDAED